MVFSQSEESVFWKKKKKLGNFCGTDNTRSYLVLYPDHHSDAIIYTALVDGLEKTELKSVQGEWSQND